MAVPSRRLVLGHVLALLALGRFLDLDGPPAHRASVMHLEPRGHALAVEEVVAGEKSGLVAKDHVVDANDALGLVVLAALEHLLVNVLNPELFDGGLGGRRSAAWVLGGVLLAELGDDAVKGLLRVNAVVNEVKVAEDERIERVEDGGKQGVHETSWHSAWSDGVLLTLSGWLRTLLGLLLLGGLWLFAIGLLLLLCSAFSLSCIGHRRRCWSSVDMRRPRSKEMQSKEGDGGRTGRGKAGRSGAIGRCVGSIGLLVIRLLIRLLGRLRLAIWL